MEIQVAFAMFKQLLTLGFYSAHRPASMSGESSYLGSPPPQAHPVRSMLDITTPAPKTTSRSAATSPTEANHKANMANGLPHRSLSDAASHPAAFGPRAAGQTSSESNFYFNGFQSSNLSGAAAPKRNTQGAGWAKKLVPSAMAEVVRGGDLSTFGSRDRGRNHSVGSPAFKPGKSSSPHNRWSLRSSSPKPDSSKLVLKDGQTVDKDNAYRRLSDANLARSKGSLSSLSGNGQRRRTLSGSNPAPNGARLEKDYTPIDGEDAVVDSSDDESRSSEEERYRGRRKTGRRNDDGGGPKSPARNGFPKGALKYPQSQMAAAEEERESFLTLS